ncbi:MAG: DUF485 domain-containing protein [Hyphomicrobiaceae bacterium]|nr:DUF485 domain-containing protein [Hyphomicrobiaceae bacterium]
MQSDNDALIERVKSDPQFQELIHKRSRLAWILSVLMLLIYFGFILAIAFDKQLLAEPLSGGTTTLGIPVGVGVIISAFILTAIYVIRANSEFDELTKQIVEKVKK